MVHWRVISWISVMWALPLSVSLSVCNEWVWSQRHTRGCTCTCTCTRTCTCTCAWWESVFLCHCTHFCFAVTHVTKQSEIKQNLGENDGAELKSLASCWQLTELCGQVTSLLSTYLSLNPKVETVLWSLQTRGLYSLDFILLPRGCLHSAC